MINNINLNNILPIRSYSTLPFTSTKKAIADKCQFSLKTYSNFDREAKKIENKMLEQMYAVDNKSISSLVNKVSKKTGKPKEEVQKTLIRLAQFSSYSQLDNITEAMSDFRTGSIYSEGFSLANVLLYLQEEKKQFDMPLYRLFKNKMIFLDGFLLDYFEKIKDTKEGQETIEQIKKGIKEGEMAFFAFDGWDAKVDGEDISHTMFGSFNSLEKSLELALGKDDLDETLNGQTIKRAQALFGEDVEVNIIQNKSALEDCSIENIVRTMAPNKPSLEEIEATIEAIAQKNGSIEKLEENKALLCRYFKRMLNCYSCETITQELKKKYKDIEEFVLSKGKTTDDVYYLLPSPSKSFDLITYHYLKANNISADKVISEEDYFTIDKYDGKVIVILDDIVGSGKTMLSQGFDYLEFANISEALDLDINLVFAPLSAIKEGRDTIFSAIEALGRKDKDAILVDNIVDFDKFIKILSRKERNRLQKLIGNCGYGSGGACTSMPYMIPDNCSQASGILLMNNLNRGEKQCANKAIKHHQPYTELINKKLEKYL